MEVIVKRHAVSVRPRDGEAQAFSDLQWELRKSSYPIRIAAAPTGAGKSFVFRQAVRLDKARVLFMVPTRRLAQNLMDDMIGEFKTEGLSNEQIESRVRVWSSDQTTEVKARDPTIRMKALRINEADSLAPFGKGDMIIAVPETVNYLLTDEKSILAGNSRFSIFHLLDKFDHIVFDEFHTIEPRGFGMAAMFAFFAAKFRQSFPSRVSFLSATPLDIRPVLKRFGIDADAVCELSEDKSLAEGDFEKNDHHVIHGDVRLRIDKWDSLPAVIEEYASEILRQAEQGSQTVIIYNALIALQEEREQLERIFEDIGIPPEECLLINSIDDTDADYIEPGRFAGGRKLDPKAFKVLIATSSVEMGVNFKANLLMMEPGFEPMNFLQRYGRAARGDCEGQVIVRIDDRMLKQNYWLRQLWKWTAERNGERVSVLALRDALTESMKKRFSQKIVETEESLNNPKLKAYFGQLPGRALYNAGLYWHVVENHNAVQKGHQRVHFRENRPAAAKEIWRRLQEVKALEELSFVRGAAERWIKGFKQQALKMRSIGRSVRVIEDVERRGRSLRIQEIWLQRYTKILDRFPLQFGENGEPEVRIPGEFKRFLREKREYVEERLTVLFPHTNRTLELADDYEIIEHWCKILFDPRIFMETRDALEKHQGAMKAAETLVRKTGLLVVEESQVETNIVVV